MLIELKFFERKIENFGDGNINSFVSATSGGGFIILGDETGIIHLVDSHSQVNSFMAFDQHVLHLKHVAPNFLIAVGNDSYAKGVVKIFNMDKTDPQTKNFFLVKSFPLFSKITKIPESHITAVDVSQDFGWLAVGFETGSIALLNGDLSRGKILLKVLPGNGQCITGLKFKKLSGEGTHCLFCTTIDSVFQHIISPKGITDIKQLDSIGCEENCCALSNSGDFVIGRRDGVWFYKTDERAQCLGFQGQKVYMSWFRHYLAIVSVDLNRMNQLQQVITIYDIKHKFIAFKMSTDKLQVKAILQEFGALLLFAKDNSVKDKAGLKVIKLEEKDTQSKLEILFKKRLFNIAIGLVEGKQLDDTYVGEIFKKYGDHLYFKKDYDGAMQQYIRTIGKLESSHVIKKFLFAQQLPNLVLYLEHLHEAGVASSEHTTLLINCYTKLRDKKDKLDKFIKSNEALHYDVDTAIRVCRSAGYKDHALILATKNKKHEWYVKIQLEDFPNEPFKRNIKRALKFIESLPFEEAEILLKKYGKAFVSNLPKQATNVLIRLCTDYEPTPISETNRNLFDKDNKVPQKEENEEIKAEEPKLGTTPRLLGNLEALVKFGSSSKDVSESPEKSSSVKEKLGPQRSKAEDYIQAFTNHPYWLMVFLENVILRNPRSPPQPKIVFNTLLELYMQYIDLDQKKNHQYDEDNDGLVPYRDPNEKSEPKDEEDKDNYDIYPYEEMYNGMTIKERVLEFIENPESNYDSHQALIIVHQHKFKEGILKLYERLGMYHDIIQYFMEQEDIDNTLRACNELGGKDPNIWIQLLAYLAQSEEAMTEYIIKVLQKIDRDNLLPPLQVIQILSRYKKTQIGVLKDYLAKKIHQEQTLITEDMDKLREYQSDTLRMRRELEELRTTGLEFKETTCSLCNGTLEPPTVHFTCRHSYHKKCLINLTECYKCARMHKEIIQRKKMYEISASQHEQYFKQLKDSGVDGFSVVSEYFGRGIFKKPHLKDLDLDDDDELDEREQLFDEKEEEI